MPFWQSSSSARAANDAASPSKPVNQAEQMTQAQADLTKARRNLIGAMVLLLAAFLLIPLVLDKKPRAWGNDVILNMPKAAAPFQKNQSTPAAPDAAQPPAPIDSTAPLKPSQPVTQEASTEPAPAVAGGKVAP